MNDIIDKEMIGMDNQNNTNITDVDTLRSQTIISSQPLIVAEDLKKNQNPNVLISKKNIDLVREKCKKSKKTWLPELLFGLATTSFGAIISFLTAGVAFNDWKAYVGYIALPLIFVGCGISWLFVKNNNSKDNNELVDALERHIFSKIKEGEDENNE